MTEYHGTQRWFGARFDTPMYSYMPEVPAPVDQDCGFCEERIAQGEPGLTMPFVTGDPDGGWTSKQMAVHFECQMRSVMGPPAHLDGQCSCHGGPDIKSELTYRQQAIVVMVKLWGEDWFERALAPDGLTLEERAERV